MFFRGSGLRFSIPIRNLSIHGRISTVPLLKSRFSTLANRTSLKILVQTQRAKPVLSHISRSFSNTTNYRKSWENYTETSDRYTRLNRFQQFQRSTRNNNSLNSVTLIGLVSIAGIFFLSPYVFDHIPPFTYFKKHPKDLVYTILGANVAIFGLWQLPRCWRFLQKYMLLRKDIIYSKWAIIGSAFSHQEFWHLGMNMLALWSFGTSLATMLGASNFFSLYMTSAIGGSLFSLWYPKIARLAMLGPSLGASGALFGVLGCFSYLIPNAKILLFVFPIPGGAWVAFLGALAWNAAGCIFRWGSFDYAAHLGGSAVGIMYGWLISKQVEKRRQQRLKKVSKWI